MSNNSLICPGVHYVGVNDRTTHLFENLWPLPVGVSYNSYVVRGSEKTALIDTVETGGFSRFIENIHRIADGKIDYLVVNHMEPDHSGSISAVVGAFPDVKIIGNRQTIAMIGGFYGITDPSRFIEVKDGDIISLGDLSLQFFLTPMVHWPETMMTLLPERSLLFAGDAFGCFGALNGTCLDTCMDTDRYFPEMERYYACIVGKYGKFVERAMNRLSGVDLQWICSTHGPVWHDRIPDVLALYSRMSRYEAEDGATIIYGSMYGNTAEAAAMLAEALAARGVRKIRVHNASASSMSDMITDAFRYKALIVGSPTYSMHLFPPVEQFMIAMETREIRNRVFASFGSFTWSDATEKAFASYVDKMNLSSLGHVCFKQHGGEPLRSEMESLADSIVEALRSEK